MNDIVLRPSYWASVSGGKDSLYMLYLLLQHRDKYPLDGVVHFELDIDYPFIKDVISYMQSECEKYNIKFIRIKPTNKYEYYYNKWGFPTRLNRWCNSSYKLSAKRLLIKYLRSRGEYLVSYIGYCADETNRFQKRIDKGYLEVYPLVEFGIYESTILNWAKKQQIFNDYYLFNKRCGCMYCPCTSLTNLAYLLKYYPDNYNKLISMVKDTEYKESIRRKKKYTIFGYNGTRDIEYIDSVVRSKYLPRLDSYQLTFGGNDYV